MKFLNFLKKIIFFVKKKEDKNEKIPYDPRKETSFDVDAHADPYQKEENEDK